MASRPPCDLTSESALYSHQIPPTSGPLPCCPLHQDNSSRKVQGSVPHTTQECAHVQESAQKAFLSKFIQCPQASCIFLSVPDIA